MIIKYKKMNFKKEEKTYFSNMEKPTYIVLDSTNIGRGKGIEDEYERIKSFVKEQFQFGTKGLYYNYIIGKSGQIYQTVPTDMAGTAVTFNHYSYEISKINPKYFPLKDLHQLDGNALCISICCECDVDENIAASTNSFTEATKESLEDFIAYYVKNYEIDLDKCVYNRSDFTKDEKEKNACGHKLYKGIIPLILLKAHAISISKSEPEILLEEIE